MVFEYVPIGREYELLGAEPELPTDIQDNDPAFNAWVVWTSKASMLRFRLLNDSVEIAAFHGAASTLLLFSGSDALREFIDLAFEPASEAYLAAANWIDGSPPKFLALAANGTTRH
jgi:hypothetical protein